MTLVEAVEAAGGRHARDQWTWRGFSPCHSYYEAKRFIGTWRLVSDSSTGLMYYDALGNMAAQVMPGRARPKYAGVQPTPDEAKEALTGYLAYFGSYSVNERAHTITHHRKGNINPGQIDDDAVRRYEFVSGDRLILTPVDSANRITWERAK